MENLSTQDQPPLGGSGSQTPGNNAFPSQPGPPAEDVPQLPPQVRFVTVDIFRSGTSADAEDQMFTTAAQLLDLTDSEPALPYTTVKQCFGIPETDTFGRLFAELQRNFYLCYEMGENLLGC